MAESHSSPRPWNALILAGGRSSRMGRDKAMLDWHGRPLLAAQIQHMQALGATDLRVSGNYPEYGGIADRTAGLGPLGGLQATLANAPDGCWLVLPVDMPLLGAAHLHPLLAADPAASAVCYRDHVLPMRLTLGQTVRAAIDELIAATDTDSCRSLRALHQRLQGLCIECPAEQLDGLRNCNTPDEWQEVHR